MVEMTEEIKVEIVADILRATSGVCNSDRAKKLMRVVAGGAGRWKSWGTVYRDVSKGTVAQWRTAGGIDWMTGAELKQSIPPAYTEYIGKFLIQAVEGVQGGLE